MLDNKERAMLESVQESFKKLSEENARLRRENERLKNGIKREMPDELKKMLSDYEDLVVCGGIRSYYDDYAPEEYEYADSSIIHNFFSRCEELVWDLKEENIKAAEERIKWIATETLEEFE